MIILTWIFLTKRMVLSKKEEQKTLQVRESMATIMLVMLQPTSLIDLMPKAQGKIPTSKLKCSPNESIVGYFQNLTKEQQCGVVGFLTNVVSVLGNISSQKPISMRSPEVSCFSTCSTPSAIERKTPLIVDKQDHSKFDDVQVNPLKLRTAEMKCLTSKDTSRMLLNKVEDLVFSQEEYFHSKGVAGLDQHKQEALKEYLNSKCSSLGINPVTPKVYTTSLQNKIGNARHTQKPKLSKV